MILDSIIERSELLAMKLFKFGFKDFPIFFEKFAKKPNSTIDNIFWKPLKL